MGDTGTGAGDSLQRATVEFYLGDGCIGVCFCQNSWNRVQEKPVYFIVRKLYFHRFDLKGKINQGREEPIRREYQPEGEDSRAQRGWRVLLWLVCGFGSELGFSKILPILKASLKCHCC